MEEQSNDLYKVIHIHEELLHNRVIVFVVVVKVNLIIHFLQLLLKYSFQLTVSY
jgi:hypothetical protein